MPSNARRAAVALLAASWVAGPGAAQVQGRQEPPAAVAGATGPSGTSSDARYDAVGYAGIAAGQGTAISVAHRALPPGSFVELTALDTGRTIVALVGQADPVAEDRLLDVSAAAARALGLEPGRLGAVRVRAIVPPPGDQSALRSGAAAELRMDAPPVLLTALRKRLPPRARSVADPAATPEVSRPSPRTARKTPAAPPRGGQYYVQVAALSDASRAGALAAKIDGRVASSGALHRVQIGPFATAREAQAARDGAVRRGYGDARIVQIK